MGLSKVISNCRTEAYLHGGEGVGYAIAESLVDLVDVNYVRERNAFIEHPLASFVLMLESKAVSSKAVIVGICEKLPCDLCIAYF